MILTAIQSLWVINLFTAGIVAGGLIHAWKLIVAGFRELPPVTQVRVHQGMLFLTPDRFMQPCGMTAGGTAIVLAILEWQADLLHSPLMIASVVLIGLGMIGNIGVVITSRYFGTRINAIIATWSLDAIPPEYPAMRRKWDITHFIRMSCGVEAFICYLLAFLCFALGRAEDATSILNIGLAALIFVSTATTAILAGTTAMVCLNIAPEKYKMPKTMAMQTHHAMFDLKKDAYMKPVGIASGLSALAILILLALASQLTLGQGIALGIDLVGFVITVVTANRFLLPFHANILTWSTESPPPEYDERMQAFQRVMFIRLAASCVSLLAFLLAMTILTKPD